MLMRVHFVARSQPMRSVTSKTAIAPRWLHGEAKLGRGTPARLALNGARAAGPLGTFPLFVWFFFSVLLLPACEPRAVAQLFDASAVNEDSGIANPSDASTADLSFADARVSDQRLSDQGLSDQSLSDQSLTDQSLSDRALTDLPSGDLASADQGHAQDASPSLDVSSPDLGHNDLSSGDLGTECSAVALPDIVSWSTLPAEGAAGLSESTTRDGYNDAYLHNSNSYTKVGVRQDWGGTIIFFGLVGDSGAGQNNSNTIDGNDTGREVQVAFYDPDRAQQGCAYNASCQTGGSGCGNSITYLGWNPVQGGNRLNNGSGINSISNSAGLLSIETHPLQWNPNWDRQDCVTDVPSELRSRPTEMLVRQEIRFVRELVVEIHYTLINDTDLAHGVTGHEMPTVYTSNGQHGPDLWRFMLSDGNQATIDQPGNDGFFYKNVTSPGGWVSMQNEDKSYGVGMYYENRLTGFQGWQNRDLPFNNFRAQFAFKIPARNAAGPGMVEARAYLILGSYATVGAEAAWLDSHIAPFGSLDVPARDVTLSGVQNVRGWALDNKTVSRIALFIDGVERSQLSYGDSRPDVCQRWPGYHQCNNVGYSGSFDFSQLSACQHQIEIAATDDDGNTRLIAANRVTVSH